MGSEFNRRVRVADLKQHLRDVPPEEVNRILFDMMMEKDRLVLYPLDHPREITPADVKAAVPVSGQAYHIIYMER